MECAELEDRLVEAFPNWGRQSSPDGEMKRFGISRGWLGYLDAPKADILISKMKDNLPKDVVLYEMLGERLKNWQGQNGTGSGLFYIENASARRCQRRQRQLGT